MGDQSVDPKAEPGSYEKTKDGYRLAEPRTKPAALEHGHSGLDLDTAKAIAEASEASGFPAPPQVLAVIQDAADQAKADAVAERQAAKTTPKPTPAEPPSAPPKE